MPSTPISCSAVFTASSLEFWMTASTLVMMLFSDSDPYGLRQQRAATLGNQSFSRQELSYSRKRSRLRTQHRTRSLYRLKSLHGNRNYLSHPSGFVMQSSCHPEQPFFAQRGIWASRAKRRVLCDAMAARLARSLLTSPAPSAPPEALAAWQTSRRPPERSPSHLLTEW